MNEQLSIKLPKEPHNSGPPNWSLGLCKAMFSIAEVCQICNFQRSTFYAEVKDRRLKKTKVRGKTMVIADDLQRYIDIIKGPRDV